MTQIADNTPILTLNNDEILNSHDFIPLNNEQQKILEEFKLELPNILNSDKEAHDDEAFCDDACLHRYLRATKWNLINAKKRLKSTLDWRRSYQPHKLRSSDFAKFGEPGQMYLNGFDLENHPVIHMILKQAPLKQDDTKIKFMVYTIEAGLKCMPPGVEKICVLIDWRGQSTSNSMGLGAIKECITILSQHYPERLVKMICIDPAWILSAFFKLVLPLFDPITREKVAFVYSKDKDEPLSKLIDKKYLTEDFGGTNKYEFNPKVYFEMLAQLDP